MLKLASEKIFLTLIGMRNAKERTKMLRQSGLTLALLLDEPILHSKVQQAVDSLQNFYFIMYLFSRIVLPNLLKMCLLFQECK